MLLLLAIPVVDKERPPAANPANVNCPRAWLPVGTFNWSTFTVVDPPACVTTNGASGEFFATLTWREITIKVPLNPGPGNKKLDASFPSALKKFDPM
jgi:hypothetical protein